MYQTFIQVAGGSGGYIATPGCATFNSQLLLRLVETKSNPKVNRLVIYHTTSREFTNGHMQKITFQK
jgi:hypothetical protein